MKTKIKLGAYGPVIPASITVDNHKAAAYAAYIQVAILTQPTFPELSIFVKLFLQVSLSSSEDRPKRIALYA